ncbi:MAG TPA: hypothetical protein VMK05_17420 [Burkholderiales bacterium]|nr:hypothetical protein [Burkholderiales bacterium]
MPRLADDPMRLLTFLCAAWLIAAPAHAQMQGQNLVGRYFWYEPAHEKYAPIDFYRFASFEAPITHVTKLDRFEVMGARRGWFALRFESLPGATPQLFMPISIFRSKWYQPDEGMEYDYDTFRRASIFDTDPTQIQAKLEGKDPRAAATKDTPKKLQPWQKYKENWNIGNKTDPKRKRTLPDDGTGSDNPDAPPN